MADLPHLTPQDAAAFAADLDAARAQLHRIRVEDRWES
jgi:hypothetical protein